MGLLTHMSTYESNVNVLSHDGTVPTSALGPKVSDTRLVRAAILDGTVPAKPLPPSWSRLREQYVKSVFAQFRSALFAHRVANTQLPAVTPTSTQVNGHVRHGS